MKKTILLVLLSITTNLSQAALVSRLGGLAYYDDVADLTWLADANAAVGSAYDTFNPGSGLMTWANGSAWAAGLNVGGVTGWRLPNTVDVGNDGYTYTNIYQGVDYGYNITAHSEMSNMSLNVLGNLALYDTSGTVQPGSALFNTGPFSNLLRIGYWSATEYAPNTSIAWIFNTNLGFQLSAPKYAYENAWAVHSGDVSAVPIPTSVWLFGTGLIGLVGVARRRKR